MSRERSISLEPLSNTAAPTPQTHYAVTATCTNCDYDGQVHLPRGTACAIGDICPVECPHCGCDFLTREEARYPIGLQEFVEKCVTDKVIIPKQEEVATSVFSTLEGCWKSIHANHMTYLSREREERNVQHRLQERIRELETALTVLQTRQAITSQTGASIGVISTPGGTGSGIVAREVWHATMEERRRAVSRFGQRQAQELEETYLDRNMNGPAAWPNITGVRVTNPPTNQGITIIGGGTNGPGIAAVNAAGRAITATSGLCGDGLNSLQSSALAQEAIRLAIEQPVAAISSDPTDIVALFNAIHWPDPTAEDPK